jgi:hypothetical protein
LASSHGGRTPPPLPGESRCAPTAISTSTAEKGGATHVSSEGDTQVVGLQLRSSRKMVWSVSALPKNSPETVSANPP